MRIKFLYRSDDGVRFKRNKQGKFQMDIKGIVPFYEYEGSFLILKGFVDKISKCKIIKTLREDNSHN